MKNLDVNTIMYGLFKINHSIWKEYRKKKLSFGGSYSTITSHSGVQLRRAVGFLVGNIV